MVSTDPVSDMLTRIRNAASVNKLEVLVPHSRLKEAVAKILSSHNYIGGVSVNQDGNFKQIVIEVTNPKNKLGITEIVKISKPGRRSYSGVDSIPTVKGGRGIVILSTSKGIMTGEQAKKARLGGELICQVY